MWRAAAHHAVCVLGEPLQREQRVVRLNDHVTHLILVGEDRVRLDQLLRVPELQQKYVIGNYPIIGGEKKTKQMCLWTCH